jgi:hypothetical protein
MSKLRLRPPSPALLVATIALIVALGGTSYAAFKIGTNNIKNGAVTTKKLRNGAVTQKKLGRNLTVANALHSNSASSAGSATNASNAGNANTVGGYGPSELTRFAFKPRIGDTFFGTADKDVDSVTMTLPRTEFVRVMFT